MLQWSVSAMICAFHAIIDIESVVAAVEQLTITVTAERNRIET